MTPRPLAVGDRVLWLERMLAGWIRLIASDRCIVTLETGRDRVIFCDDLVQTMPPHLSPTPRQPERRP